MIRALPIRQQKLRLRGLIACIINLSGVAAPIIQRAVATLSFDDKEAGAIDPPTCKSSPQVLLKLCTPGS